MLPKIIEGIAAKIRAAFGDGYKVYLGEIRQGLEPPCFAITRVDFSGAPFPCGQRTRTYVFDVMYFPKNNAAPALECDAATDALMVALEWIDAGSSRLYGSGLRVTVVDGVLHATISYAAILRPADENPDMMEELELDGVDVMEDLNQEG